MEIKTNILIGNNTHKFVKFFFVIVVRNGIFFCIFPSFEWPACNVH
jgi:hypothetical protein